MKIKLKRNWKLVAKLNGDAKDGDYFGMEIELVNEIAKDKVFETKDLIEEAGDYLIDNYWFPANWFKATKED